MTQPHLQITDLAAQRIQEAVQAEGGGLALRVAARRVGLRRFRYALNLEPPGDAAADDVVLQAGDVPVRVDPESAALMAGATIDYVEDARGAGFKFDNPQSEPSWSDPVSQAIQRLLDDEINPALGSHGGFVELAEYRDGIAYVLMGGGCHGCGQASLTLNDGVAARLVEAVPELREVRDLTDHSTGTNPYHPGA